MSESLSMTEEKRKYSTFELCQRLLCQARPYWGHMLGIGLLSLVSIPLALLMPWPLKVAVDSVIGSEPLPAPLAALVPGSAVSSPAGILTVAVGLVLLIALATQLQAMGSTLLSVYTSQKLNARGFANGYFPTYSVFHPLFMTRAARPTRSTEFCTTRPPFRL